MPIHPSRRRRAGVAARAAPALPADLEAAAGRSASYLASARARAGLDRDPYWPKWDSPWWHMTLLWELGLAERIPSSIVQAMTSALNTHYVRFFPADAKELPPGADPIRHVPCHCALGTIYQVLAACGVRVRDELRWVRGWFLKYQLPDGGLNCDERAYAKPAPKSSMVSTLPPLEAVLSCRAAGLTSAEEAFLDRGAAYLAAHRLFRAAGDERRIINRDWLKACFPRFYEYDILRGLRFLARWSEARGKPFPAQAAGEALGLLRDRFPDGQVAVERAIWRGERTIVPQSGGRWSAGARRPASSFELLRLAGRTGRSSPALTRELAEVTRRASMTARLR